MIPLIPDMTGPKPDLTGVMEGIREIQQKYIDISIDVVTWGAYIIDMLSKAETVSALEIGLYGRLGDMPVCQASVNEVIHLARFYKL